MFSVFAHVLNPRIRNPVLAARALFESGEPPETSRAQIEAIATAQQQA